MRFFCVLVSLLELFCCSLSVSGVVLLRRTILVSEKFQIWITCYFFFVTHEIKYIYFALKFFTPPFVMWLAPTEYRYFLNNLKTFTRNDICALETPQRSSAYLAANFFLNTLQGVQLCDVKSLVCDLLLLGLKNGVNIQLWSLTFYLLLFVSLF